MIARKLQVCATLLLATAITVSPLYAQAPDAAQLPGATPTPSAAQPASAAPASTVTGPPLHISLGPDLSHGRLWFPTITAPYRPQHIPQPALMNSPRLAQLIQDGKLNLSLDDAVALALENNLDISVQRYVPLLDEMQLLLARSGQNGRVVFDPTVTGSLTTVDATIPIANPLLSGIGVTNITSSVSQHTTTGNFGYTQGFATGTQVQMSFNNSRSSSSTSLNVFNPSLSSTLSVAVTQPLLNGFGILPNRRYIVEGKNSVKIGEWQFKLAVINDITTTADDYWNLVYARQNVKVGQQTVSVDQQLYDDNKKELAIGTMAPLDVLTAQSQLAADQEALVVAQTLQLEDETKLLTDITRNPVDPILLNVEIVPTTPISSLDTVGNPAIADAVQEAWQNRPEMHEAELNLKNDDVEVKVTTNQLLPSLNLIGQYSTTGLGGISKSTLTTPGAIVPITTEPILLNGLEVPGEFVGVQQETTTTVPIPGGITDAWSSLIHSRFPTFEAGLQLTLPIRNRANQASNGIALLNQREQTTQYQAEKNTIYLSVREALINVTQDRAAVQAAETARQLAQQTYDDERRKYELGSSTTYNVVLRSRDLSAAEVTELQDQVNLMEAIVALDQAMGRTLEVHNITIADDKSANVTPIPNIPGTPIPQTPAH